MHWTGVAFVRDLDAAFLEKSSLITREKKRFQDSLHCGWLAESRGWLLMLLWVQAAKLGVVLLRLFDRMIL